MNWLDIVIIVILIFSFWKGFRAGLAGAIGGFLGIIVGIWAGSHFMTQVGEWLMQLLNVENQSLANIISFILIFIAINVIFSILVWIVNKVFNVIPFIGLANKLAGSFIGVIGGILGIAALVYLLSLFAFSDAIGQAIADSQLASIALSIAVIVKPLIPVAIKSVQEII
ncbi:CvpA family protein [bacterium]|jgi:membrane protein required for colicin V production|nr:CvpA family protein [bacterium]